MWFWEISTIKMTWQLFIYHIINLKDRAFPQTNLALIYTDGTVYQISLQEQKSKGLLLQLPKSKKYHGYSDAKGILYFIDGELRKGKVSHEVKRKLVFHGGLNLIIRYKNKLLTFIHHHSPQIFHLRVC